MTTMLCYALFLTVAPTNATAPPQTTVTAAVIGSSAMPGVFNCTFESDLCGWSQDKRDQFDWQRHHGATMSTGTGPTSDHTTGTSGKQLL